MNTLIWFYILMLDGEWVRVKMRFIKVLGSLELFDWLKTLGAHKGLEMRTFLYFDKIIHTYFKYTNECIFYVYYEVIDDFELNII